MNAANLMGGERGKRGLSPISPLADVSGVGTTTDVPASDIQVLLDHAQTLTTGEELMFAMDIPYVPAQGTPIVLVQAAAPSAASPVDFILKECQETQPTPTDPTSAMRGVNPAYMLRNYYASVGREIELADTKITLLQGTKHGKLTAEFDNTGLAGFRHDPTPGFLGNDRAIFMAEYGGKHYKIILDIKVLRTIDEKSPICPEPQLIRVKNTPSEKPASSSSGFDLNGISIGFVDLPSSALGQTTGTTITLDTHAAGYNWFIDPTPFDNSEYLPTANPNEWIAKAGSDAAGKMDMLSVLLHEYGHALGIGHSASAHDYMATTLQPGVRRLPSADELELMAQLAGEIKNDLADAGSNTPLSPQSPLPSLPLGGAFGVALLGRLRGTRYSGWTHSIDSVTQYAIAANPKLSNPDFADSSADQASGWSTTGKVRFEDGAATLTETAESQTRLNQVFIVGETDRFLSFTVANTALDDATNAPDDAFEVALLDANTEHK